MMVARLMADRHMGEHCTRKGAEKLADGRRHKRRLAVLLSGLAISVLAASAFGRPQAAKTQKYAVPTYTHDIAPLMRARCVVCHAAANLKNGALSGGLALDTYSAVISSKVFAAGKSGDSELVRRLAASSPATLMPKGGPALLPAQIAMIRSWIDGGAPEGVAESAGKAANTSLVMPMPPIPGRTDVSVDTNVVPTADLIDVKIEKIPKNAKLQLAFKVGPVPPITSIAYSPNGKMLAVGTYRAVILWDTTTGQPVRAITHLADKVQALAFRPDGSVVAVAGGAPGAHGDINLYDTSTWTARTLVAHTDVVYALAWSADGIHLAAGSQDRTATVWEWPSGKLLQTFKDHADAVTAVAFALDGASLYTASQDHNIRRYDIAKGVLIRAYPGHNDAVLALAATSNGSIVTAGQEPELRWWNVTSGDVTGRFGGHGGPVTSLSVSKDGKFLASASADHSVRVWDGGNGGAIHQLDGSSDWMYAAAISPDDKFTAGGGADGLVRIWETRSGGSLLLSLIAWPPSEDKSPIEWVSVTPQGYFNGSAHLASLARVVVGVRAVPNVQLVSILDMLRQPANVLKSWQDTPGEAAKLPTTASKLPITAVKVVQPAAAASKQGPTSTTPTQLSK